MPRSNTGFPSAPFAWPNVGSGRFPELNQDSPQYDGLVFCLPMFGHRTFYFRDRVGNRVLTPFNAPIWTPDSTFGNALLFDDGSNEYLYIASAAYAAYPITLSARFYSDDLTILQCLVGIGKSTSGSDYVQLLAFGSEPGDPVLYQPRGAGTASTTTTTSYSANVWHHACGVSYAANDHAVFIDAGGKATSNVAVTIDNWDSTYVGMARDNSPNFAMSGRISDVRIYNRALSDEEVFEHYINWQELYTLPPRRWVLAPAPAVGAIMNQIQFGNVGADLFNGTLL